MIIPNPTTFVLEDFLCAPKNTKTPDIKFPSEQYSLKLSNTTIGEISDDTTVS